jgi:histidinol dehydrogenase
VAEAIELANVSAAEHLVVDDDSMARQVRCAGSLFIGQWSAQVAGDYAIGTNHVLPTAGAARVRGGLSGADFVRQITVQRVTAGGLRRIGETAVVLATAEGLKGHAASVAMRLRKSRAR